MINFILDQFLLFHLITKATTKQISAIDPMTNLLHASKDLVSYTMAKWQLPGRALQRDIDDDDDMMIGKYTNSLHKVLVFVLSTNGPLNR